MLTGGRHPDGISDRRVLYLLVGQLRAGVAHGLCVFCAPSHGADSQHDCKLVCACVKQKNKLASKCSSLTFPFHLGVCVKQSDKLVS